MTDDEERAVALLAWINGPGRAMWRDALAVGTRGEPLSSPSHAFAERLCLAGELAAHSTGVTEVVWSGDQSEEVKRRWSARLSSYLMDAAIYVWTADMRRAANRGTCGEMVDLIEGTRAWIELPHPICWFTWDADLDLSGTVLDDFVPGGVSLGVLYRQERAGQIALREVCRDAQGRLACGGGIVPRLPGSTFHRRDDSLVEQEWLQVATATAMFAFLDSPYIPKRVEPMPRAARRRAERAEAAWADETVTFVQLRRPLTRDASPETSDNESRWNWQWLVSGHFRRQWFPGQGAHRIIWIPPHLKGPAGLPLKPRAYKVTR